MWLLQKSLHIVRVPNKAVISARARGSSSSQLPPCVYSACHYLQEKTTSNKEYQGLDCKLPLQLLRACVCCGAPILKAGLFVHKRSVPFADGVHPSHNLPSKLRQSQLDLCHRGSGHHRSVGRLVSAKVWRTPLVPWQISHAGMPARGGECKMLLIAAIHALTKLPSTLQCKKISIFSKKKIVCS